MNNHVYLITGGSGDVGVALIKRICADDAQAVVYAQGIGDMSALQQLASEEKCVQVYSVDLCDAGARQAFAAQLAAQVLPSHFVHLPALQVVNTKFRNFDEERFEKDFSVQVRSALELCKLLLPTMAKEKYGRVVFMLTNYILGMPPKNVAAYVMAKNALQGLAKSLAADYAAFGVTVNCIAPYMIETGFLSNTSNLIVEASAENNPMHRNATVSDVVPAMAFLLGDEAGFITGVTLPITGGANL